MKNMNQELIGANISLGKSKFSVLNFSMINCFNHI
jgi:hypothetical protein